MSATDFLYSRTVSVLVGTGCALFVAGMAVVFTFMGVSSSRTFQFARVAEQEKEAANQRSLVALKAQTSSINPQQGRVLIATVSTCLNNTSIWPDPAMVRHEGVFDKWLFPAPSEHRRAAASSVRSAQAECTKSILDRVVLATPSAASSLAGLMRDLDMAVPSSYEASARYNPLALASVSLP